MKFSRYKGVVKKCLVFFLSPEVPGFWSGMGEVGMEIGWVNGVGAENEQAGMTRIEEKKRKREMSMIYIYDRNKIFVNQMVEGWGAGAWRGVNYSKLH